MSTDYGILVKPFEAFFSYGQRTHWLYLLSALTIAVTIIVFQKPVGNAGRRPGVLSVIFPARVYFHSSAINDYFYFFANSILQLVFIFPVFAAVTYVFSTIVSDGLYTSLPHYNGILSGDGFAVGAAITLLLAIVADFSIFFAHYMQHKIPWLWEFHKVHHSAEVLTPITLYRMHPVDNILSWSLAGVLSGSVLGVIQFISAENMAVFNVGGANVIFIAFYLLGYNLRHSHIWLSYGPVFSRIFISPAQHQIHHSTNPIHFDKNLGLIFAFWDGLFGTLYVPEKKESISFGLNPEENKKFSSFWSLFLMPFINLFRNFRWRMLLESKRYLSVLAFAGIVIPAVFMAGWNSKKTPISPDVFLEDLTWKEVERAVENGYTTALVPTGGTEQNGPHLVLGKHNYIVKFTAGKIAEQLGNALVAPVIAYVPEGNIDPPDGHMRFTGTLTIPQPDFERILEFTAASLKRHGFKTIAFVGDSGGNQDAQKKIAEQLNRKWAGDGVTVINVSDYYKKNGQLSYLMNNGFSADQIGGHAGIRDTSELLAVYPGGVRKKLFRDYSNDEFITTGADGDSSKANVALGNYLLDLKVNAAVEQIRSEEEKRPSHKDALS